MLLENHLEFSFHASGVGKPKKDNIIVLPTPAHIGKVNELSLQRYLWVASNSIKASLLQAGLKSDQIWNVNPWAFLDLGSRACGAVEPQPGAVALLTLETERDMDSFKILCERIREHSDAASCHQAEAERMKSIACPAELVIIYATTMPDWLFIENMLIEGKIILAPNVVTDDSLRKYHENFMYFFTDTEDAVDLLKLISRNWEYFRAVAKLAGSAFEHIVSKHGSDAVCKALSDA